MHLVIGNGDGFVNTEKKHSEWIFLILTSSEEMSQLQSQWFPLAFPSFNQLLSLMVEIFLTMGKKNLNR